MGKYVSHCQIFTSIAAKERARKMVYSVAVLEQLVEISH